MNDFSAMQTATGQDSGSLVEDPQLVNSNIFDNAAVFSLQYDNFSDRDYTGVISDGYATSFKTAFVDLYNYFVISADSDAVNNGEMIPASWPDIRPWDGSPDIGMSELDKAGASLLGHWSFENAAGDAEDSSFYGRTALFYGNVAYTTTNSLAGNVSAVFDGTSGSYIKVEESENFSFGTNDFTIAAWIKIDAQDVTQHRGIVSQGQGYQDGQWAFYVAGNGKQLRFFTTQNGTSSYADNSITVADGNPHHVAVVRRGDSLLFYVDGQADPINSNYANFFTGHNYDNTKSITIGARGLGAYRFIGLIDDVRIYDKGLLQSEIDILSSNSAQ